MKKIFNKKITKKGFTLAELLIVVAILAILVAVSIPIFTSKLHDAKDSTDVANVRAAKAAAVTEFMTTNKDTTSNVTYCYDASNGIAYQLNSTNLTTIKAIKPYNKCSNTSCTDPVKQGSGKAADTCIVQIVVNADGKTVTASWVVPTSLTA